MMNLIQQADELFSFIKQDFTDLWELKHRQSTLEIVTPYTTLAGDAVSVFLTQRDFGFVVSDGGRLAEISEEEDVPLKNAANCKALEEKFGVKQTAKTSPRPDLWYKVTPDVARLSACVYDVALFQMAIANAVYQQTLFAIPETRAKMRFDMRLKELIVRKVSELSTNDAHYEVLDDPKIPFLNFTTGIRKTGTNDVWVGVGIHRSNPSNFERSVALASFGFKNVDNHFSGVNLRKGAIVDVLPDRFRSNPNVIWLQGLMTGWTREYGASTYEVDQVEAMKTMDLFFNNPAA